MNLNKVFLIGRLTRDPEIRVMPSGQQVANFSLATDRFYMDKVSNQRQQKTEFHNIVMFGRLAEIAGQYLKKGGLAMIEGRLQTRDWQDQSGQKRYRTEIVAETMQMGPRTGETSGGYQAVAEGYNSGQAAKSAYGQSSESKTNNNAKAPEIEPDIPIIEENDDIDVKNIPF